MPRTAPLVLTLGILASPVLAGPDADGYTWATIDHAGNRSTNASETPMRPDANLGAVGYEYRMATTEVTVGQWFEFVQAYAPHYPLNGGIADPAFTSHSISYSFAGLFIRPNRSPNRAADMSWEYAARYVNWLHNGKVNEQWAFETGVYDTATFTFNPDGTPNHQTTRAPGARYWIPSIDEWVKAAHYDPNRYGPGQEGYWLFPNGSNEPSIGGLLPGDGGQSNAGGDWGQGPFPLDVGSFPDVQSPFGLLDLTGGVAEWLEPGSSLHGVAGGTPFTYEDSGSPFSPDRIEFFFSGSLHLNGSLIGLRLASVVPTPGTMIVALSAMIFTTRRSR
ncbi:MAG: SUMF1/EgtB/PvdO family nonheme iron enzyme [Phycisphaerales bacterium]|nr:SUMF1/EgtB/PvdO family nonheme iron enzyme [Planctomycetota bacterium]MCH8508791.1 SUMF1/EgtB/PvdO family nonheme iron enzyme [Phycisphaerales bacterium]